MLLHLKYDKEYFKKVFLDYFSNVKENEKDLLVTRFILMKIIIKRVKEAFDIYQDFKNFDFFEKSLFNKMFDFLFLSIKDGDKNIFGNIVTSFENSFKRDKDIKKIMSMIGSQYFGIQDQGNFNLMSMMGSMFS